MGYDLCFDYIIQFNTVVGDYINTMKTIFFKFCLVKRFYRITSLQVIKEVPF